MIQYRDQIPPVLPITEYYFDFDAFHEWLRAYLPDQSYRQRAAALGLAAPTFQWIYDGKSHPSLESYLRMLAAARLPLGTWLRV